MSTHLEPQTVSVGVGGPCIPMRNQPGGQQDSPETVSLPRTCIRRGT